MEEDRLIMSDTIKNPEYVDLKKTKVRFTLVSDTGVESVAELTVPQNKQRGVNKYWDRIMDEFDIEEMRNRRNILETERMRAEQHRKEKIKNEVEINRLRHLFDAKARIFELPFIKESDIETKAAIRRAPTIEVLNFIVSDITKKYIKENNMTYNDYLDYLEDLEDEE